MSSAKNSGLTTLMIGSIFLFVISAIGMVGLIIFDLAYLRSLSSIIFYVIPYIFQFVATLLLMIGFIQYRGAQNRDARMAYGAPIAPPGLQTQNTYERFCPKCGRSITSNDNFCPHCGWQSQKPIPR